MCEEFDYPERQVGSTGLLVRLLRLVKSIIGTEPVRVGKINLWLEVGVLFREHEGFVPLVQLHVQCHQTLDVTQHQEGLLGEGMVARLSEILCTKLDLCLVLTLVQVLAHFHD
jgi:hypothetical protein